MTSLTTSRSSPTLTLVSVASHLRLSLHHSPVDHHVDYGDGDSGAVGVDSKERSVTRENKERTDHL